MNESDIWRDMEETMREGFGSAGFGAQAARNMARTAVDALHSAYSGQRLGYLPKKRQAERHEMVQAFNGKNGMEVAEAYGVSRATVYRQIGKILRRKGRLW